jgi:probable HAF family extracellular repeat protein
MRIPSLVGAVALVLSSLTHAQEVSTELRYRIVKLDRNGGAAAINNRGSIAGFAFIEIAGLNRQTPILWRRSGAIIELRADASIARLFPLGLNDLEQVVGTAVRTDMIEHGFVWTRGQLRDIGDLPGGADRSGATDINNRGQVVGSSDTAAGGEAILWEHGNLMSLGDLPGGATASEALAINEHGTIVGVGSTARGARPFVWRHGVMKQLRLPPELRQTTFALARDINSSGLIVGHASATPLLWPSRDENAQLLPIPAHITNAAPFAVNDRGDIVGWAFNEDESLSQAVIWRNGRVSRLGLLIVDDDPLRSCVAFELAIDINQRGEIAAVGQDFCENHSEGATHAYRLVPVKP